MRQKGQVMLICESQPEGKKPFKVTNQENPFQAHTCTMGSGFNEHLSEGNTPMDTLASGLTHQQSPKEGGGT